MSEMTDKDLEASLELLALSREVTQADALRRTMSETCKSTCCKTCGKADICDKVIVACLGADQSACTADALPCEDWIKREENTEVLLRQANERAGNLAGELAAMTANRDELRKKLARVTKGRRMAEAECDELRRFLASAESERTAANRERDALRREVAALVDVAVGENNCAIYHRRKLAPCKGQAVTVEVCRRCVIDWARQQAAQAGKDGAE